MELAVRICGSTTLLMRRASPRWRRAGAAPTARSSRVAKETKATLQTDTLEAVADRGYFSGEEILACDQAGITVTLPKPMTSGAKSEGRFGKQDFVYLPKEDVYRCPAGERLKYYFDGARLDRYREQVDAC